MSLPGASSTEFRMKFSCTDLPSMDLLSKSDPMVVLFGFQGAKWVELGRTEQIQDCPNPNFTKGITTRFDFEKTVNLRAVVYDVDNATGALGDQDFIGELLFTLGEVVGARGQTITRPLKKGSHGEGSRGSIKIYGEEVNDCKLALIMKFRAEKLDKKDFFGKSDPYIVISRKVDEKTTQPIFKSEVIRQNLNPVWKPIQLSLSELCNGKLDKMIKIDCYDWDSDTSSDFIGSCEITAEALMKPGHFDLINPKKKKSGYTNSGVLILDHVEQIPCPSFLDYIAGGYNISIVFAIDFTGSNGTPSYPSSLHFLNPQKFNGYQTAITSVGNVVAYYDYDKMFPVYGFGGCFPPSAPVSHNFALTGNPSLPEVFGIEGVLGAYTNCVANVALAGPTNFAPVISYVVQLARESLSREELKYFILLILTDGEITDMDRTIDAIVEASALPISIIITGIGNADFANMNTLDGDEKGLVNSRGVAASRDIVQFVPLRDMPMNDPGALAAYTLAEIPEQFLSYMRKNKIAPPPRIIV